jgi:hypothetical protein
MLVEGVASGAVTLKRVWVLGPAADGRVTIESEGRIVSVPEESIVSCPVPAPRLSELRRLDGCFGESDAHFIEVHRSPEQMYRLLRCREHGRLFLEDTIGGVLMYTRTVLVDDTGEKPDALWRGYHGLSDDWLNYLGIVAY